MKLKKLQSQLNEIIAELESLEHSFGNNSLLQRIENLVQHIHIFFTENASHFQNEDNLKAVFAKAKFRANDYQNLCAIQKLLENKVILNYLGSDSKLCFDFFVNQVHAHNTANTQKTKKSLKPYDSIKDDLYIRDITPKLLELGIYIRNSYKDKPILNPNEIDLERFGIDPNHALLKNSIAIIANAIHEIHSSKKSLKPVESDALDYFKTAIKHISPNQKFSPVINHKYGEVLQKSSQEVEHKKLLIRRTANFLRKQLNKSSCANAALQPLKNAINQQAGISTSEKKFKLELAILYINLYKKIITELNAPKPKSQVKAGEQTPRNKRKKTKYDFSNKLGSIADIKQTNTNVRTSSSNSTSSTIGPNKNTSSSFDAILADNNSIAQSIAKMLADAQQPQTSLEQKLLVAEQCYQTCFTKLGKPITNLKIQPTILQKDINKETMIMRSVTAGTIAGLVGAIIGGVFLFGIGAVPLSIILAGLVGGGTYLAQRLASKITPVQAIADIQVETKIYFEAKDKEDSTILTTLFSCMRNLIQNSQFTSTTAAVLQKPGLEPGKDHSESDTATVSDSRSPNQCASTIATTGTPPAASISTPDSATEHYLNGLQP